MPVVPERGGASISPIVWVGVGGCGVGVGVSVGVGVKVGSDVGVIEISADGVAVGVREAEGVASPKTASPLLRTANWRLKVTFLPYLSVLSITTSLNYSNKIKVLS